jgi:site-specific DNA recombinase
MRKAVGIWIRVSTEDQVKGESPEHHEKRAQGYADAKGWYVAQVYRLDAVSGKAVIAHPEAQQMIADIRSGRITGLVFSKLARLARNTKELLEFADIFRAANADLVSLQEAIDTSTAAGRLFFTMIAAMAEWEREEIADRVRASVPIRAQLGKPTGGQPPFGYHWHEKKLQPHPDEAPIRLLVHELFLEHRRKKTTARILNERGYRTRNGSQFTDTTIDRLLRDTTAKGVHRANYTRAPELGKAWELKPESDWVLREVEPIVSEELWDRCVAILDAQKQGHVRRPTRKTVHLFAGYAHCECGGAMHVPSRQAKYVCTDCHHKIPISDLEAVYEGQLSGYLLAPTEIAAHFAAAKEAMREKAVLIERAAAELKKVEAEEDELFRLYHQGAVPIDDFGRRHRPLSERRAQLADELPRLEASLDVLRTASVAQEVGLEDARDLSTRWPSMEVEARRQVVETITSRIIVGKEDIEIVLQLPFGTDARMATSGQGFMAATSCTRAG